MSVSAPTPSPSCRREPGDRYQKRRPDSANTGINVTFGRCWRHQARLRQLELVAPLQERVNRHGKWSSTVLSPRRRAQACARDLLGVRERPEQNPLIRQSGISWLKNQCLSPIGSGLADGILTGLDLTTDFPIFGRFREVGPANLSER